MVCMSERLCVASLLVGVLVAPTCRGERWTSQAVSAVAISLDCQDRSAATATDPCALEARERTRDESLRIAFQSTRGSGCYLFLR